MHSLWPRFTILRRDSCGLHSECVPLPKQRQGETGLWHHLCRNSLFFGPICNFAKAKLWVALGMCACAEAEAGGRPDCGATGVEIHSFLFRFTILRRQRCGLHSECVPSRRQRRVGGVEIHSFLSDVQFYEGSECVPSRRQRRGGDTGLWRHCAKETSRCYPKRDTFRSRGYCRPHGVIR